MLERKKERERARECGREKEREREKCNEATSIEKFVVELLSIFGERSSSSIIISSVRNVVAAENGVGRS